MKRNVNLYRAAEAGGPVSVDARMILIAWLIVLATLGAAQVWLGSRNAEQARRLADLQRQTGAAQQQLNALTAARMAGSDAGLEAELNEALRELDLRETILGLVSGRAAGDVNGFSAQLRSLARQDADGVWLTRVRVAAPGARTTLEGRALSPGSVPVYLRGLSREPALAGQRFDQFQIARPEIEGEAVSFALNRIDKPEAEAN